jgi:hypothetical protein
MAGSLSCQRLVEVIDVLIERYEDEHVLEITES